MSKRISSVRTAILAAHRKLRNYRDVAELPEYSGIPPGTLCSIVNGDPVPDKWRKKLGLASPRSTRPPRLEIRKDDPESAAISILDNMGHEYAQELVDHLWRGIAE